MPTYRAPNPPGHASAIDVPGLHGFQGLAQLIYSDDGESIFKPDYKVTKQTEYLFKIFISMAQHFVNISTEELEVASTELRDAVSMNYLAARLYTGSRVKQDRNRALKLWTIVSHAVEVPDGATITHKNETTRRYARVKADAYAYLCTHHLRNFEKSKALPDLAQAFLCGEGAAKLGLFVACSHYTVLAFYELQNGQPERTEDDVKITTKSVFLCTPADIPTVAAIVRCKTMLESQTWAEFSAPEEVLEPEVYTCSRPGCTVRTTVRSDLKRCAGLCIVADKPAYCTKQCQKDDWKRHRSQCKRPTEEDRVLQFNRAASNEKVDVDTSGFNSVELARAREVARGSLYERLRLGDNPSPVDNAFGDFMREMEESSCGGARTAEQFVQMVKHMPKYIARSDMETILQPKRKKSEVVQVSNSSATGMAAV